jgi:plastocyanin
MLHSLFSLPAACHPGASQSAKATQPRPSRTRCRPSVESLEGRALLATVTVHLENFFFTPQTVTIHQGDSVNWIWDTNDHSTTSVRGSAEQWDSGVLNSGAMFSHTFMHAGSFEYYCVIHGQDNGNGTASGMFGTVTVMANATQPTLTSISVSPANPTIGVASTQNFTATGTFSDNSQQNISSQVTWASANTGVASITSTGLATGVSAGTSMITASLNGITGSTNLTVGGSNSPSPTPTPTFVSESRVSAGKGAHKKIVGFNLVFSGALDPNSAMDTANYQVTQPGATKKAHPKAIFVGMAMYTPSTDTVMIMLGKFNTGKPLTLTASGLKGATEAPIAQFTTKL